MVVPVLICGSETWVLRRKDESEMEVAEVIFSSSLAA
jgi:hypothetical protein